MRYFVSIALFFGVLNPVFAQGKTVSDFYFGKAVSNEELDTSAKEFSLREGMGWCWVAQLSDHLIGKPIKSVELFKLPDQGSFESEDANMKVTSSADKKTWTIVQTEKLDETQMIERCWFLDPELDPKGAYLLNVNINGEEQVPIRFTVVD
ncbi:hypothetical protein [Neisseria sp. Ec49-e6-T10]|uniref:hypothetical protein n=1 Tax=Neisseria sp. Ec49-e6-T10 TaxID=3140744 RepID=UPI003EBECFA8